MVSHDADFLDSVCTDVVHLEESFTWRIIPVSKYLWTLKRWNMKVLDPQNMGHNMSEPLNMKVVGSHGS